MLTSVQEVYDYMMTRFCEQGRLAVEDHNGRYTMDDGTHCPVGFILHTMEGESWEGCPAYEIPVDRFPMVDVVAVGFREFRELCRSVQNKHDLSNTFEEAVRDIAMWASDYGLDNPPIVLKILREGEEGSSHEETGN